MVAFLSLLASHLAGDGLALGHEQASVYHLPGLSTYVVGTESVA